MVRDTNITDVMKTYSFGNLPDILEIQTELPDVVLPQLLLGSVSRWVELRDYYSRPIRIYAVSDNPLVEKYIVGLVNNYKDLYITIIPKSRKEMLEFGETDI